MHDAESAERCGRVELRSCEFVILAEMQLSALAPGYLLAGTTAASFLGFYGINWISRLLAPAFVREGPPDKAAAWHVSVGSMANAVLTSPFAYAGLRGMMSAVSAVEGREATPPALLLSCGITCGYFLFDCLVMTLDPEGSKATMGKGMFPVMWMHHIVSLLVWPYGLLAEKGAWYICYMLCTEVTNVGLNGRFLVDTWKLLPDTGALAVGLGWALSFLVVRMIPIPWILAHWGRAVVLNGAGLPAADRLLAFFTVPIPIALNCHWFYLIGRGAMKKLRKTSKA